MDAPTYPPAIAFEQPVATPYVMQLENTSLAELMSIPPAWEVVIKHMPALKFASQSPSLKPYLDNMTVKDLAVFTKKLSPEVVATINQVLARLPAVEPQ